MGYVVVITPAAEAQISRLPPQLATFVRQQLAQLGENPTALSKPSTMLGPRGQLFEIKYDQGGVSVWITVIFRFGQDEQTLHVEHIAIEFG